MTRLLSRWFPIGTRSVLFGAHCWFIHPWFVALAWWRLYGFPWDPRLWALFFVHDLGYLGKPNMDGPEGETHPEAGAAVMHWLFDRYDFRTRSRSTEWRDLSLYHSRFYARRDDCRYSALCPADKLAAALEPWWLYLPRVVASGEVVEFMSQSRSAALGRDKLPPSKYSGEDQLTTAAHVAGLGPYRAWHVVMTRYCRAWAYRHADGRDDTWTKAAAGVRGAV